MSELKLTSLADRALLARLHLSTWNPYAYDSLATTQVEIANGVHKAGRFNKHLMKESKMLASTNAAFNAVYLYHIRNTVPWLDDGMRILASDHYMEYAAGIRPLISEAEAAADRLQSVWASEVANDKLRLGDLWQEGDYPKDVRSRYGVALRFLPVPSKSDFRVQISDVDKASLDAAIKEAEENVTTYLLKEITTPVRALAARLSEFTGAKGQRWHNSLVDNVIDLVERIPRLNVNKDPTITALSLELRQLIRPYAANPEVLKEDAVERTAAQAKMEDILARMGVVS